MIKFTNMIKTQIFEFLGLETTGVTPLIMKNTVYDDILAYHLGSRFDSTRGKIDNNIEQGGLDFNTGADVTNFLDALTSNYQLPHKASRDAGAYIYPHVHWLQKDVNLADWKVEYRILNGGVIGAWVEQDKANYLGERKTYPGTGDFVQITSFAPIDISGLDLSSIVQVRVWRDTVSVGHTDTIVGNVTVVFVDSHVPIKYQGSQDELVQ